MLKRTITGAVMTALVVGVFFLRLIDVRFFDLMLLFIAGTGTFELTRAFGDRITKAQKIVSCVFPFVLYPVYVFFGIQWSVAAMVGFALLSLSLLVIDHKTVTVEGVGLSLFAEAYPSCILLSVLVLNHADNLEALILCFVIAPCADVFAYLVGSLLKGKKLCPEISPKKTISGAIGGLVGGIVGSIVVYFCVGNLYFSSRAIDCLFFGAIGLVGSLLTEFGDLAESMIKRKTGIKDMGNLFPGHGGMLDRIDGMMFASAFLCFVFTLLQTCMA